MKVNWKWLALVLLLSVVLALLYALRAQAASYYNPADDWHTAGSYLAELDANAIATEQTRYCRECGRETNFQVYCAPEYTRSGNSAATRGVGYSDGTLKDGSGTGDLDIGRPNRNGLYARSH